MSHIARTSDKFPFYGSSSIGLKSRRNGDTRQRKLNTRIPYCLLGPVLQRPVYSSGRNALLFDGRFEAKSFGLADLASHWQATRMIRPILESMRGSETTD
jgi:hypothetical protein